ncbi:MAG: hypothetical protein LBR80_14000, partial [Deltaproteobacteria bacterium]|jgi:diacylglycerol kinase family enzyme|nr:hypothetical protein [Deltaproteobacteria bacterium]
VLLFKSTGIFSFISKGFDYLYGKYRKYPELISYMRAREIAVRSDLPLMLQLDGEVFVDTNITVRIVPDAVKFISVGGARFRQREPLGGDRKGAVQDTDSR